MIFAVCVGLCVVHVSPHVGSAEAHCVLHTFYSHLGVEAHAVQSLSNEDGHCRLPSQVSQEIWMIFMLTKSYCINLKYS
jgi:hypothetical protein